MPSSLLTIALLLVASPCLAQAVADPGRRLTPEEIKRLANYQLSCGAPASRRSYSVQCAEANDIYLRACEGMSPRSQ